MLKQVLHIKNDVETYARLRPDETCHLYSKVTKISLVQHGFISCMEVSD